MIITYEDNYDDDYRALAEADLFTIGQTRGKKRRRKYEHSMKNTMVSGMFKFDEIKKQWGESLNEPGTSTMSDDFKKRSAALAPERIRLYGQDHGEKKWSYVKIPDEWEPMVLEAENAERLYGWKEPKMFKLTNSYSRENKIFQSPTFEGSGRYHDTNVMPASAGNPVYSLISPILAGDSSSTRTGRNIRVKQINFIIAISIDSYSSTTGLPSFKPRTRVSIILDKKNNPNTAPQTTDVFQTFGQPNDFRAKPLLERFEILKDKTFTHKLQSYIPVIINTAVPQPSVSPIAYTNEISLSTTNFDNITFDTKIFKGSIFMKKKFSFVDGLNTGRFGDLTHNNVFIIMSSDNNYQDINPSLKYRYSWEVIFDD